MRAHSPYLRLLSPFSLPALCRGVTTPVFYLSLNSTASLDDNVPDIKNEIIRRLDYIQQLAKQKNYAKIEKLLKEGYV